MRSHWNQQLSVLSNSKYQRIFHSAFTKARTLAEEVFCHVIEQKGEIPSDSGNIDKLYKQVKNLFNMHNNPAMDKRIPIKNYYTRLYVYSAVTLDDFTLAVANKS